MLKVQSYNIIRKRRWKEITAVDRARDRGLTAGNTLRVWCCRGFLLWVKGSSRQGLCRAEAKGRDWLRGGKGGGLGYCSSCREQQEGGR